MHAALVTMFLAGLGMSTAQAWVTVTLQDIDSGSTSPTGQYRWWDAADQQYAASYKESYDYTQAIVQIEYQDIASILHGIVTASNLKPNFTYQLKLVGISETPSNERIGFAGRWWQEEWSGLQWINGQNLNNKGDGSFPSPNDETYLARRGIADATSPTGKHYRYTAYLVFEYFTTDQNGQAVVTFQANSSYHVLWKTVQRSHTSNDGPIESTTFDPNTSSPAYNVDYGESTIEVFGEWERLPVSGVKLLPGLYEAQFILTEESFHGNCSSDAGCWAGAMGGSASFVILTADFDEDDDVDIQDLGALASAWLTGLGDSAYDNLYDISDTKDEFINLLDFSVLAAEWLWGTNP